MGKAIKFILLVFTIFSLSANAQNHGYGCVNQLELISTNGKIVPKENYKPVSEIFPLFGKYARDNGRSISYPFGIEFHSLYFDQPYIASNLMLRSDSTDIYARADTLYQNTTAYELRGTFRPNLWLFPFLNVYGIFGYTKGMIKPNLTVPYIVLENVPIFDTIVVDTTFEIHDDIGYVGPTYGAGATFSFGYKFMFIVAEYYYTVTDPTDLDDNLHNHFFSPKIGVLIGKSNKVKWALWLGSMYIKNDQAFVGKINVAEINPMFEPLFGKESTYSGEITAISRWNFIFGGSISINDHHFITLEGGLFERKQISFSYNYSF